MDSSIHRTNVLPPIAVLGAGSWGTALALILARQGNTVRLWGRSSKAIRDMEMQRQNYRYLPGITFPDLLEPVEDLQVAIADDADLLIAVPSHAFRSMAQTLVDYGVSPDRRIAWGTKGLDPDTCNLLHHVIEEILSKDTPIAVLSGPTFALEVATGKPTAISLAGNHASFLQTLVSRLHSERFRVYINHDLIGVELCGAVKNVMAIAVGVCDGMSLGANARCALITRGLAEMTRLSAALGGQTNTLLGLAGVGDLVLTCTDNLSRNRRFGLSIGQGQSVKAAYDAIGQVVEGVHNAKQVLKLASRYEVEMPITEKVNAVVYHGASPGQVVEDLLGRTPTVE